MTEGLSGYVVRRGITSSVPSGIVTTHAGILSTCYRPVGQMDAVLPGSIQVIMSWAGTSGLPFTLGFQVNRGKNGRRLPVSLA